MADIVEDPKLPAEGFRFHPVVLDHWFDGRARLLHPNLDYPGSFSVEDVQRRLQRAAWRRGGTVQVWEDDEGIKILCQLLPTRKEGNGN